jgi:hypothetical protein
MESGRPELDETTPTTPVEVPKLSPDQKTAPGPVTHQTLSLDTLRPEFKNSEHGRYLGYLENALQLKEVARENAEQGEDLPRNIALTGGYGVGKSSVLQEYARKHPLRTITISLSTVSPSATGGAEIAGNVAAAAEDPVSGQIQKSIVKQLLYSRAPASVPGSRFDRIDDFNAKRASGFAAALLIPIGGAAYLADSLKRPEAWLRWNPWGVTAVWLFAAAATFFALILAQRFLHNRFRIERFTAGPATIDLGGGDQTYFDRYLDEIMYFFQRTGLDVVIFEDLDRFNDAEIFEQLRELNTILNSAQQLPARPIRFVYAVRDSLFETAPDGSLATSDGIGREVAGEAPPSVRAKFFDLIIPMVPFATPRTSRDLMRRALRVGLPGSDGPMERLLGLAAPFIQDARLISNIGNEYRIFSEHVLSPKIDGMRKEALAAMVVYKNLNLADYEKIRTASSKLDDLEVAARSFVRTAVSAIDSEIAALDSAIAAMSSADERADDLVDRLDKFATDASNTLQGGAAVQYFIGGQDFSRNQMRAPEFWARLAQGAENLTIRLNGTSDNQVDRVQLEAILGSSLAPQDWDEQDTAIWRSQRAVLVDEKERTRSASFADLMLSPRTPAFETRDKMIWPGTFADFAEAGLTKGLNLELVRAGFIDWNYSLYVSRYIGETTTAAALNFAIKYTQANEQNFFYPLSDLNDIPGLIVETGDALFHSRSAFNVYIVDALLGDERFAPVLDLLSDGADDALKFIAAYLDNGTDPQGLVQRLATRWPGLLVHLANLKGENGQASTLIDKALHASPSTRFDSSDEVRATIEKNYTGMSVFADAEDDSQTDALADTLMGLGIEIADLTTVPSPLKEALGKRGRFKVNAENIRVANGGSLAVDGMVDNEALLRHVLRNFDDYEAELGRTSEPSVADSEEFGRVLSIVSGVDSDRVAAIAGRAAKGLAISNIGSLNQEAWAGAMAAVRVTLTVPNLTTYIAQFAINDELVQAIEASPFAVLGEPVESASERVPLAREVLSDGRLSVGARVSFLRSMQFETPFDTSRFTITEGELMGDLVHANLIPDTAATFAAMAGLSWESKEHFIVNAPGFSGYLYDVTLEDSDVSAMVEGNTLPIGLRDRLVVDLANLSVALGSQGARDLIRYATGRGLAFDALGLRILDAAGPGQSEVLAAIACSQAGLAVDDLLTQLRGLGGDIAALAERGSRPLNVPEVAGLVPMLGRLKSEAIVSSWADEPVNGVRRVNMKQ